MAGTKLGGQKCAETNKKKYGADYYKRIGKAGGSVNRPESRPFSSDAQLASEAGRLGGLKSRRKKR